MRRWLAGLFLILLAGVLIRQIQVETDSGYAGERGPYLQTLTPSSVVVRWETAQPEASRLQLQGRPEQNGDAVYQSHRIALQGLSPATTYRYTVGDAEETEYVFHHPAAIQRYQPAG